MNKDEAKVRYCVEGCGSHTRGKIKPVHPDPPNEGIDVCDSLVCPWCSRAEDKLKPNEPDCGMALTGHDNRRDWVKGAKWRK